jgi:RHS repeat-associated protein
VHLCVLSASRYTGKERDSESGNDYFGARYYASSMGRFMSPDPSQLYFADPTNPQTFNLYSYAVNNPLKFVDPTGMHHCVWDSATGDQDDKPEDGGASEGDCDTQGGTWEDDPGDSEPDPVATFQMNSNHPDAGSVGGALCAALPSAGVQGYSGSLGFLGAPTGSLELVTNYRTGQVSGFAAGGISAGWNNGVASASGYVGLVSGLKGDNSNYPGGFTSGTIGVSTPVPFVGVQMTGSSSSGGLTGSPRGMLPNPADPNAVNSITFGANAALKAPTVSVTAAVTNYSKPLQLGHYWTLGMNLADAAMFMANQACEAAGH